MAALVAADRPCSFHIIAVNRAGVEYPGPVDAWVSYHPENFPGWFRERISLGGDVNFPVYSHLRHPCVTHILEHETPSGSSALLAARVGLRLGFHGVILVGCPLDDPGYLVYHEGWRQYKPQLQGRVRAMSGWLGQYLGFPVRPWLEELT